MSQDVVQNKEQPHGVHKGNSSFSQCSDAVLKTLEEWLIEFGNVAVSVSIMNKSLTALCNETVEIKAQRSNPTDQGSSSEQPNDQNKWPQNDAMHAGSSEFIWGIFQWWCGNWTRVGKDTQESVEGHGLTRKAKEIGQEIQNVQRTLTISRCRKLKRLYRNSYAKSRR